MKPYVVLLLALAVTWCGCQSMSWPPRSSSPTVEEVETTDTVEETPLSDEPIAGPGLVPSAQPRFSDIPLPMGVEEDGERTYVYESSSLKIGRMVYTSRATVSELGQFYVQECPGHGWTMQNLTEAEGNAMLVFTKPGKRLEVTAENLGALRKRRLTVTLTPDETGGGQL